MASWAPLRSGPLSCDADDSEAVVPNCNIWIDNPKPPGYQWSGSNKQSAAEAVRGNRETWVCFKTQIIQVAHMLGLGGWQLVSLGNSDAITVEQMTGALTNDVYVVTIVDGPTHTKAGQRVLLRVYGRQVEHLIDRDSEFRVLQRLACQKSGPRLLGTFKNGRFEEFFDATTLTSLDFREPKTSRRIARCLRKLHNGVKLLPWERQNGPGVWKNWERWLEKATKIVTSIDKEAAKEADGGRPISAIGGWIVDGYICGTTWTQFRDTVEKYRAYLNATYSGETNINNRLVLAHNDVHPNNILRMRGQNDATQLAQDGNESERLILIDFEYAGPNTLGYEFANYFREWMYDCHDPAPDVCHVTRYPTLEQQQLFINAYLDHMPPWPSTSSTFQSHPGNGIASCSIGVALMAPVSPLKSNHHEPGEWCAAEHGHKEHVDWMVRELLDETHLWRPANNAHWFAWGIIQATITGLDEDNELVSEETTHNDEGDSGNARFDYLRYAQEHAFLFWGDMVQMGLVKETELPAALRTRLKIVPY